MRSARGFTLVELAVVLAILATLVGFLSPLFFSVPVSASDNTIQDAANGPPRTSRIWTRQHDGHWWVMSPDHFVHHPDCPCHGRTAERPEGE